MKRDQPIRIFRAGTVSASVFEKQVKNRDGQEFTAVSICIDRAYPDPKNQTAWKYTNSFRAQDLPRVELVVNRAWEFVAMKSGRSNGSSVNVGDK